MNVCMKGSFYTGSNLSDDFTSAKQDPGKWKVGKIMLYPPPSPTSFLLSSLSPTTQPFSPKIPNLLVLSKALMIMVSQLSSHFQNEDFNIYKTIVRIKIMT